MSFCDLPSCAIQRCGHRGEQHGERTCEGSSGSASRRSLGCVLCLLLLVLRSWLSPFSSSTHDLVRRAGVTNFASFINNMRVSVCGYECECDPRAEQPWPRLVVPAPVVRPIRINCGRGALRSSHGQHLSRSHRQQPTSCTTSVSLPTQRQQARTRAVSCLHVCRSPRRSHIGGDRSRPD